MDRGGNRRRNEIMTITAGALHKQSNYMRSSRTNRNYEDNIRAALNYIGNAGEPVVQTRILYICRYSQMRSKRIMDELLNSGLIAPVTDKDMKGRYNTNSRYNYFVITNKGRQVMRLMNEQASLINKAPWSLENTD